MTSQGGEQLELRSGKVNFFVLDQNLMTGNIDDQIAKIENLNLRLIGDVRTTEEGTHASDKLARRERFNQIVVCTKLEADDTVLDLALRGKHDDGHIGGVANGTTHALARKLGKHEVQHDQVKLVLLKLLNSGLTVTDADDPIALALEVCSDSIADGLLVLDQKDLPCI